MNDLFLKKDLILNEISKNLENNFEDKIELISKFENEIKKYNDNKDVYYISLNNNLIAYKIIIDLLTYNNKNKIIVPTLCPFELLTTILNLNLIPIFCEVNNYGNIDENYLLELLLKNNPEEIAAIFVFHNNGIVANIDEINNISKKYEIKIIEDVSEAFASEYKNKNILNSKNNLILTLNENNVLYAGGISIIITSEEKLKIYLERQLNNDIKYLNYKNFYKNFDFLLNKNFIPNVFDVIVGLNNLKFINTIINLKKEKYNYYLNEIKKLNFQNYHIITNEIPDYCTKYNYNSFRIIVSKNHSRDLLTNFLNINKINFKIKDIAHYKNSVFNFNNLYFKKTNIFDKQSFLLPLNNDITIEKQSYIINKIKEYFIFENQIKDFIL